MGVEADVAGLPPLWPSHRDSQPESVHDDLGAARAFCVPEKVVCVVVISGAASEARLRCDPTFADVAMAV
jgi:hypothetical protein